MASDRKQTTREEWRKRIERWRHSGLTADQFAAELGINAGTLKYWKYVLGKRAETPKSQFVEVSERESPEVTALVTPQLPFELEVGTNRRLRIPAQFDTVALTRLLDVLERR